MTTLDAILRYARQAETRRGDTLQRIAARELDDAALWYRLVAINGLVAPYITDDAALAGEQVLLAGRDLLLVPSAASAPRPTVDPERTFGRDIRADRGRLGVNNGDLAVIVGYDNLTQALRLALGTDVGQRLFHPRYGCALRQIIGGKATPALLQIAAAFAARTLLADARVADARGVAARASGDTVAVTGTAIAISGVALPVEF